MENEEDSHGGAGNAEEADMVAAFTAIELEHLARAHAARAALHRFLIAASSATDATEHERQARAYAAWAALQRLDEAQWADVDAAEHEHQARAYAAWAALQRLDEAVWADLDAAAALTDSDERRAALAEAVESRRNGLQHDVFVAAAGGDRQQAAASWAAYQEWEEQQAAASRAAYQARLQELGIDVGVVAGANDEEEAPLPPPPPPLEAPLGGVAAGGGDEVEVAGAAADDDDEEDDGGDDGEDEGEVDENGPDDPGAPPEPGRHVARRNDPTRVHLTRVHLQADGFPEALDLLSDADDRRPIDILTVASATGGVDDLAEDIRFDPGFPRFVTLLSGQREGGRAVRNLTFLVAAWSRLPSTDMERLFRDVLPNHRTLERIRISISDLHPRFLRMLTENVASAEESALKVLEIDDWNLDGRNIDPETQAQFAQAIADMLNRNAAFEKLNVHADLGPNLCKLICQALPRNKNLRTLRLSAKEVLADTLGGVAASSLDTLCVTGSFSGDAVSSLAMRLRANRTLRFLFLTNENGMDGDSHCQSLLDLVRTYNFTLSSVRWSLGPRHDNGRVREQLDGYTRRNARIRVALQRLITDCRPVFLPVRDGAAYAVAVDLPKSVPNALLPTLLGLVSDLPTVLTSVLKLGYVNEVGILLAAAHVDGDDQHRHP